MKKKIALIGARIDGQAGVVLDLLKENSEYELVGFFDNTPELKGKSIQGFKVLGSSDDYKKMQEVADCVHIAIGDNGARLFISNALIQHGISLETLVHPTATVSSSVRFGSGCYVGPQAIINVGSKVGVATIINSGAIIEHDNKIGDAVHFAPGTRAAGRVFVDDLAFIGIGATILPDVKIGQSAMVGAGATVTKDIAAETTVIGYSSKKHKENIYKDLNKKESKIYIAQPTLPDYELLDVKFRDIAQSLMLSNFSKYSKELEFKTEKNLKVSRALTMPNATSALMLALKAFDIEGEVILPSFTFSSTGHAVVWNGLTPVFADIEKDTFNIDPDDIERKITDKTSCIIAVHCFGNPIDIERIETIAKKHNLRLLLDSAHALGSSYKGKPIGGFGDCEIFSLSGTKVITSAEGGLVSSNDQVLMDKMALGRNYGASSDYNCEYIGLNGKMSEFHAAIALESFNLLEQSVEARNVLVGLYKARLSEMPGLSFQRLPEGHVSTFKDFAVIVNESEFGMSRDELYTELARESIYSKKYFFPLHRMKAYEKVEHRAENLPNTEFVADNIICLPIFSHMNVDTVEKICYTINRIWNCRKK